MPSIKALKILATVKPSQKINQIWMIWNDVAALREYGLTYKQITEVLEREYGIAISPARLSNVCWMLRKRIKAGLEPPPESTDSASLVVGGGRSNLHGRRVQ
jgi:hypothetical protein